MKFLSDDHAISTVWMTLLIAMFGFSIVYALTFDVLCVRIINIAIPLAPANTPQTYFDNIDRFRTLFRVLPFIASFGMFMWAYVTAQKREYL